MIVSKFRLNDKFEQGKMKLDLMTLQHICFSHLMFTETFSLITKFDSTSKCKSIYFYQVPLLFYRTTLPCFNLINEILQFWFIQSLFQYIFYSDGYFF